MSARKWLYDNATETVEVMKLTSGDYEVTRRYFKGYLPRHMMNAIRKEAKDFINDEFILEKCLLGKGTSKTEYWHTTYKPL